MSDYQEVVFLKHDERRYKAPAPDVRKFNPRFKYKWLRDIAYKIFNRLGTQYLEDKVEVIRIVFDKENIREKIWAQYTNVQDKFGDHFFRNIKYRLFIGSDDFTRLSLTPEVRASGVMDFTGYGRFSNGPSRPQLFGMRVTVVPWMKGVLVVPDGKE